MRTQIRPFHFALLILAFAINLNAESPVERSNIILILTDDLDARMIEYMPNLKALLVDQGISFDNFFVDVPNCCPSRSSTLRGQFCIIREIQRTKPRMAGSQNLRIQVWKNLPLRHGCKKQAIVPYSLENT